MTRYCVNCNVKRSRYNLPDLPEKYCKGCSKPNMILGSSIPKCYCRNVAYYGFNGKRERCKDHKLPEMFKNYTKCNIENCNVIPSFNLPGKPALFCNIHKNPEMIYVKEKKCEKCGTRALYNYETKLHPIFCGDHKKTNMINIRTKRCMFSGCTVQACFNLPGTKKGIYCVGHKTPEMVNVRTNQKKCVDCSTVPYWGLHDQKTHCAKHKTKEMTFLGRKCTEAGCNKQAKHWNYPSEKYGLFCSLHAKEGMIDVDRVRCDSCAKRATLGFPGKKVTKCADHRLPNMIRDPSKRCLQSRCWDLAVFGYETSKALHCEVHKNDDEINLLERECITCHLPYILDSDGKCEICSTSKFFLQHKHLAKQRVVSEYLKNHLPDKNFVEDKTIDRGICGLERPDIRYDCKTHWLIIEVDENQHRVYECEKARMINISQSLGGMPVWFLRYNPDGFRHHSEKRRKVNVSQAKRLETLVRWLKHLFDRNPGDEDIFVGVIKLFFDGYEEGKVNIECFVKIME